MQVKTPKHFYENYIVPTYILYFVFFIRLSAMLKFSAKEALHVFWQPTFGTMNVFLLLVITMIYNDSLIFMIMNNYSVSHIDKVDFKELK